MFYSIVYFMIYSILHKLIYIHYSSLKRFKNRVAKYQNKLEDIFLDIKIMIYFVVFF